MMPKSKNKSMNEVAISEFKAKCLSLLDEVNRTKHPLRITKRGKAIADVFPPRVLQEKSWLGSMTGRMKITGDILSPAIDIADIEALQK
jgi:prevent-host-death family protein